ATILSTPTLKNGAATRAKSLLDLAPTASTCLLVMFKKSASLLKRISKKVASVFVSSRTPSQHSVAPPLTTINLVYRQTKWNYSSSTANRTVVSWPKVPAHRISPRWPVATKGGQSATRSLACYRQNWHS